MARKPRGRAARGARFDKADPAIDTAGAADENPPKPYTTGPLAPDSQSARDTTRGRTRLGVKRRKRATKHPATGKTVKRRFISYAAAAWVRWTTARWRPMPPAVP